MMSFDEFSRAAYAARTVQEPASFEIGSVKKGSAKEASPKGRINNISIDLDDGSRINLILYPAGGNLFGRGDMIPGIAGASEALGVVGVLEGDRLILEMVSPSGDLYRVDLSGDESGFSGDFVKITPEGETAQGTAKETAKGVPKEVAEGVAEGVPKGVLPKNAVVIGAGVRAKSPFMPSSPAQTSS